MPGRQKGGKEKTRKVTVRLPADHPVFLLPERQRSAVLREWVEYGRLIAKLEERLTVLEVEVRELRTAVSRGGGGTSREQTVLADEERKKIDDLLKYFE